MLYLFTTFQLNSAQQDKPGLQAKSLQSGTTLMRGYTQRRNNKLQGTAYDKRCQRRIYKRSLRPETCDVATRVSGRK